MVCFLCSCGQLLLKIFLSSMSNKQKVRVKCRVKYTFEKQNENSKHTLCMDGWRSFQSKTSVCWGKWGGYKTKT